MTGASGFIGQGLLPRLREDGYVVRTAVREPAGLENEVRVGSIGPDTAWADAVAGIDCVIHLAGRAHVMKETAARPLDAFRHINTEGTRALAEAAAAAGVRRFIFLSSIKVNGEFTEKRPFRPDDVPSPQDAYGTSKLEGENVLWEIRRQAGMEVCVIRPPLVYGPGVKGNFSRLVSLIKAGVPLPFLAVKNRRSLVSIYNLADLICRCIDSRGADGEVLLVSDGEDISTAELIRELSAAMGRPSRLVYIPTGILRLILATVGREREYQRLCGSLQVDISATRRLLDWAPPLSVTESLRKSVAA